MFSPEDFLTTIYVLADEFCQANPDLVQACKGKRGPQTKLSPAEILALSLLSQWERFDGEREFYRFAQQRLRPLVPELPDLSQFNRASRRFAPLSAAFFQHLASLLGAVEARYEVIDRFGVATRRSGRRGLGWLPEYTDKGKCTRLGFFHGFQVLSVSTPEGVLTGLAVGPASSKDQPMAAALFEERCRGENPMSTAGRPASSQLYLADKGFSGPKRHQEWWQRFHAQLFCAPQKGHGPEWPKPHRRALASKRQIIETVHEKLLRRFRLEKERPHSISGFFARLCAKAALHNACMWINRQLGRPLLSFADLMGW